MKTWLHRISHEAELSELLLKNGYLSIGWSYYASYPFLEKEGLENASEFIAKLRRPNGDRYMDQCFNNYWGGLNRNRYSLWRFIVQMKPNDMVLVPLWRGFGIYTIEESAIAISEIQNFDEIQKSSKRKLSITDGLIYGDENKKYDLGFILKVKHIAKYISRAEYACAALIARMKIRSTNADISDLNNYVEESIVSFNAKKPLNLKPIIVERTKESVLKSLHKIVCPNKFEKLIRWYFTRVGASSTDIPPKNAKKDGDVDVIAVFESLRLNIYVQAKLHVGITDKTAIEQVNDYKEPIENENFSSIKWVISTAGSFTKEAEDIAKAHQIDLITGEDFAEMLLMAGFAGLDI